MVSKSEKVKPELGVTRSNLQVKNTNLRLTN